MDMNICTQSEHKMPKELIALLMTYGFYNPTSVPMHVACLMVTTHDLLITSTAKQGLSAGTFSLNLSAISSYLLF